VNGSRYQSHVAAMGVATRGEEGFLRDHHVVTNEDVILIVEPYAFTYPRTAAEVQLPWELDSRSWPDDHAISNVSPEQLKYTHP
jgi:hypothetical protein